MTKQQTETLQGFCKMRDALYFARPASCDLQNNSVLGMTMTILAVPIQLLSFLPKHISSVRRGSG